MAKMFIGRYNAGLLPSFMIKLYFTKPLNYDGKTCNLQLNKTIILRSYIWRCYLMQKMRITIGRWEIFS